ncbi:DUF2989 domain-containing protein [Pseudoalteromonas fenneropenaei]|uniref:DUF2989 domain-containing protein n=1 Tax=Pseudoalteromonas fenneropenaei TaxID=1737459 RepID=A0ABV7CEZ4_9GAMM
MAVKQALALAAVVLLGGCDDTLTLNKICESTPHMCSDLNTDSHCKDERATLIFSRYEEHLRATEDNKFDLLKKFEKYDKCVYRASQIEHIKLKEKTTSRVNGHLTAQKEMYRLYQDTKETNHPGLLYFHWSRNNDQTAMNKLLAIEETPAVKNDAELQLYLATYYAKFDDTKTIDILYNVLELNKTGETPNPEVYTTLVSLYGKQEKYKHAYVFAKIAELSGFKDIDILPIKHQLTSHGRSLDTLDELALKTFNSIQAGEFISPRGL